jgi:hypothetical protein
VDVVLVMLRLANPCFGSNPCMFNAFAPARASMHTATARRLNMLQIRSEFHRDAKRSLARYYANVQYCACSRTSIQLTIHGNS